MALHQRQCWSRVNRFLSKKEKEEGAQRWLIWTKLTYETNSCTFLWITQQQILQLKFWHVVCNLCIGLKILIVFAQLAVEFMWYCSELILPDKRLGVASVQIQWFHWWVKAKYQWLVVVTVHDWQAGPQDLQCEENLPPNKVHTWDHPLHFSLNNSTTNASIEILKIAGKLLACCLQSV